MEAAAEETPIENAECEASSNINTEKTPTPPPSEPQKKSKKEDKNSKKDDKSVDQFMRSLNSITNMDEKLSAVCKKYVQTAEDNKKLQFYIKQSDKRHALLLKEKEHLQHEYNKAILVKSKLENLCRELQKQNKAIKEESLLKIREEEERRKETQTKFQNTLSEITALLQQNNEKNVKLRDDNISMSEKFKSVVQQYQLREQQVDKMAKQMTLESQLADAKLQKANLEHQAEVERYRAGMEALKMTVAQYRAKVVELQGTETALRGQLAVYTDKYDEFQNALVKSNQLFGGFKDQMELMSKKIRKLEKESLGWKKRWETSQTALLDMCGERQANEEKVSATTRQLQQMQSLCRTLQAERTMLLNTLKEHNIERPPLPVPTPPPPPPAPTPSPSKDAKMDAMVANCAQLRQSLAHLQTQLNVLTTNKNDTKEETPKPEKQKKAKSKKSKADKQASKIDSDKCEVSENELNKTNEGNTSVNEEESVDNTEIQNGAITSAEGSAGADKQAPKINSDKYEVSENEVNKTNEVVNEEESINITEIQNEAINSAETLQDNAGDDFSEDKIDEKTMESLIHAINLANMNLCDLESVSDEVNNKIDIVNDLTHAVEEIKIGDTGLALEKPNAEKELENVKDTIEEVVQIAKSSPNDEISHIVEIKPIAQEQS